MKILDIKTNYIQEKAAIGHDIKNTNIQQKINADSITISQDINIKNFKDTIVKLKVEDDLDIETITKLRAEINSNSISSETIADAMINHLKNTSWHRNL